MPAPPDAIAAEVYATRRRDAFAAEERRLAGISSRYSLVRGALFAAFIACLGVILVRGGQPDWPWWAGAGFWLVAFLWILPYHDRVIQRMRRESELRRINEEGLHADDVIEVPTVSPLRQPIVNVVPLQLLAYFIGVRRGADVDQPRNLAKSVMVE